MPGVINLGVIDIPYAEGGTSTGDVAEILEGKYGIFQMFWELHGPEVLEVIVEGKVAALENAMMGKAVEEAEGYAAAMELAMTLFDAFITNKEMDGLAGGVPTMAAIKGISHRFKNKKGSPGRPSFVDTGTMLASMRAWFEEGE
ncbi:MAG: hypothetical protein ACRYGP_08245 [Janthinobacterium lividum]